jgi:prepilin peptidase CpaA
MMFTLTLLTVFPALTIYAAFSDLLTMTIPNRVSLLLVAGFVPVALMAGLSAPDILLHFATGTVVLTVAFGLFAMGWIGGGDAKLAAAVALWFGFGNVVEYLLLAAVAGGALTLAILMLRSVPLPAFALSWTWLNRLHDPKGGVPYGIALAAAAVMVYPTSPLWQFAS